jgi:ABC-2 type transport system permease protein
VISVALGRSVLFFFDSIFACLAFYSIETWGLSVVRVGVPTFFSGALVPLAMMPDWLQRVAAILLAVSYRVWLFGLRHYTSVGW